MHGPLLDPTTHTQTLYAPFPSPPTPAPSPGPSAGMGIPSVPNDDDAPDNDGEGPTDDQDDDDDDGLTPNRRAFLTTFLTTLTPQELTYLSTALSSLLPPHPSHLSRSGSSSSTTTRGKNPRDALTTLPPELGLHILGCVGDLGTLVSAGKVCRAWRALVEDEGAWRGLCVDWGFLGDEAEFWDGDEEGEGEEGKVFSYKKHFKRNYIIWMNWRRGGRLLRSHELPTLTATTSATTSATTTGVPTYNPTHQTYIYTQPQVINIEPQPPDNGVVTSLAIDRDWVVAGLASSRIHVFSARTGVLARTLVGHETGVWGVCLVSAGGEGKGKGKGKGRERRGRERRGGERKGKGKEKEKVGEGIEYLNPSMRIALGLDQHVDDDDDDENDDDNSSSISTLKSRKSTNRDRGVIGKGIVDEEEEDKRQSRVYTPERVSDPAFASVGWGQPGALVVSGGCDKVVKVWDVQSGQCIHTLRGHTATIRCLRVLHSRPLAISGSRDSTLRTWDVLNGTPLLTLRGHTGSVRCVDVNGIRAVSGSYDSTARLWDLETGECLQVLRGHFHQIYSVAFDGVRIATGGLDTTVRVWDPESGTCTALLQGHTALVGQLQLTPDTLLTGGSDGRVVAFCLETLRAAHRVLAHDASVTTLQRRAGVLVTGGNDGRVRVWEGGGGAGSRSGGANSHANANATSGVGPGREYLNAVGTSTTTTNFMTGTTTTITTTATATTTNRQTDPEANVGVGVGVGGQFIREMWEGEIVWKVAVSKGGRTCAVMGRRAGRTVMEVWGFGDG